MAHLPDAPLPHPLVALRGAMDAEPAATGTDIVSEIHEFAVPAFAEAALERLHGSLYASHRHLQLCDTARPVPHTWVAYRRGEIVGVLLFRMREGRAVVQTEMFALTSDLADAFCRALFSRFPYAQAIGFNAVTLPARLACRASQSVAFSENYVITLPDSVDGYVAALGKSTRKTLRGYGNRLQRDWPELRWQARRASELRCDELRRLVRQLQAFKRDSMAARGKRAELSMHETARLLVLVAERGIVGTAMVNGRLCAGSLACRFGDNYVMLLAAADPAMESYRLGMLCCFWSVCDCLRDGARECHLLWGRYQYKRQLLGIPRPLCRVWIYRSFWQMLLSPSTVMRMAWLGLRCRLRDALSGDSEHDSPRWLRNIALAPRALKALRAKLWRRRTLA